MNIRDRSMDESTVNTAPMGMLRLVFSVLTLIALGAGYIGSLWAYFALDENGRNHATEWSRLVDVPWVSWLALLVLLGSIALGLARPRRGTS